MALKNFGMAALMTAMILELSRFNFLLISPIRLLPVMEEMILVKSIIFSFFVE